MLPYAQDELSLIASVTSTNLRKIVFPTRYGFKKGGPAFTMYYKTIDDSLCRLVERLQGSGYKHRLEMVFHTWEVLDNEGISFKEFLPKFKERGQVKLVDGLMNKVVYCSD